MAVGQQGEFVAVVNDTDPASGGKSYSLKISGNNHAQLLGKKIGDTVDGSSSAKENKPSLATNCKSLVDPTRQEPHSDGTLKVVLDKQFLSLSPLVSRDLSLIHI